MLLRLLSGLIGFTKRTNPAAAQPAQPAGLDPVQACLQPGRALERAGQLNAALEVFDACAATYPDAVNAHLARASVLAALWRNAEAFEALTRACAAAPQSPAIYSDLLLWNHLVPDPDPRTVFELHRGFGEAMAANVPPTYAGRHRGAPEPQRRLRVGYVSRNFLRHSVAFFIEPVIAQHDRSHFEVYCYYTHTIRDETTERIAALADIWRHVAQDDDETLARRIHEDAIDILVDLGGHTKQNRLGVFARKPAPVQMTWIGYPDTSGLDTIDYRITDAIADPPAAAEARHTERLLRLAPSFLCYQPPIDAPPVTLRDGDRPLVFGSFNMLAKVNTRTLDLWCEIMRAVPFSQMVVKSSTLAHAETQARLYAAFEARGIESARVGLRGWADDRADHLGAYGEVDIALDTFPYNGTTTTCEALWMGAPVVTLAGNVHMSRVGATLLNAAGLGELVATSESGYVAAAVALANDRPRLAAMRRGMRARLEASPLLDHRGFVERYESGLRDIWGTWCVAQRR